LLLIKGGALDISKIKVGVTGASGMLGVYICRSLLASGAKVYGIVRNPSKASFLEKEGVHFLKADLNDRKSLTEAFKHCDAIVSNAALYKMATALETYFPSFGKDKNWDENYRANKEGTENVYEAAAAAGCQRIVQISTVALYYWKFGKPALNEQSRMLDGSRRKGGAYRATKQLSHQLALDLSKKYGLKTTMLQPGTIYGARDTNLTPVMNHFMKYHVLPFLKFSVPLVYADDVAKCVVAALKNDNSVGKSYVIGGMNITMYDICKAWKETVGKGPILIPIPLPIFNGIYFDCSKAETELGFSNRPLKEGFREILEADTRYREMGLL
jgi:dihydroflavonol-4-reductase